jgi:hypothetical protein
MNTESTPAVWIYEDYKAGLCDAAQVGTPRPPPPLEVPELPEHLKNVPSAELARDAMAAYKALGGPRFLMENQDILGKVLLRQIPTAIQAETRTEVRVLIEWASPDRLSYQRTPQAVEVIDMPAAEVIESEPWKEPTPDPDASFNQAMADLTKTHKH